MLVSQLCGTDDPDEREKHPEEFEMVSFWAGNRLCIWFAHRGCVESGGRLHEIIALAQKGRTIDQKDQPDDKDADRGGNDPSYSECFSFFWTLVLGIFDLH